MEHINLVGSVETVIACPAASREAGVTHFLGLFLVANSVVERFDLAEGVRPKIA